MFQFKKNFGYTIAECEQMIADLQSEKGRSSVFDSICGRYFSDFSTLARSAGVPIDWAEDCASEGLMHIRNALIGNHFTFNKENSDIRNWFTRVFKNFALGYKEKLDRKATAELPKNVFEDWADESDHEFKEDLLAKFNLAFAQLCAECKALLTAHYWEDKTYNMIGAERDMIPNSVNIKALRCQKKLKKYLIELL